MDPVHMNIHLTYTVQPIPLGVTFSKVQRSRLERLFCHASVRRDVRALSFERWNSIRKCHHKWDWMYFHTFFLKSTFAYADIQTTEEENRTQMKNYRIILNRNERGFELYYCLF